MHCAFSFLLWGAFLDCMGMVWIFPHALRDLLSHWFIAGAKEIPNTIWDYIPSALCSTLWKERNMPILENKVASFDVLSATIFSVPFTLTGGVFCGLGRFLFSCLGSFRCPVGLYFFFSWLCYLCFVSFEFTILMNRFLYAPIPFLNDFEIFIKK